jgi:hypothetical protein
VNLVHHHDLDLVQVLLFQLPCYPNQWHRQVRHHHRQIRQELQHHQEHYHHLHHLVKLFLLVLMVVQNMMEFH